jgi:hypothetical protein
MYDPATGRQIDHVPSTSGDISDPDKRFKRGFAIFAGIVMLAACGASGGSPVAILLASIGVMGILGCVFALSLYDDRRALRRYHRR